MKCGEVRCGVVWCGVVCCYIGVVDHELKS